MLPFVPRMRYRGRCHLFFASEAELLDYVTKRWRSRWGDDGHLQRGGRRRAKPASILHPRQRGRARDGAMATVPGAAAPFQPGPGLHQFRGFRREVRRTPLRRARGRAPAHVAGRDPASQHLGLVGALVRDAGETRPHERGPSAPELGQLLHGLGIARGAAVQLHEAGRGVRLGGQQTTRDIDGV